MSLALSLVHLSHVHSLYDAYLWHLLYLGRISITSPSRLCHMCLRSVISCLLHLGCISVASASHLRTHRRCYPLLCGSYLRPVKGFRDAKSICICLPLSQTIFRPVKGFRDAKETCACLCASHPVRASARAAASYFRKHEDPRIKEIPGCASHYVSAYKSLKTTDIY